MSKIDELLDIFDRTLSEMITYYSILYTEDELKLFINYKFKINKMTNISIEEIRNIESSLKEFVHRIWDYELKNGKKLISWLKNDAYENKELTFCTLIENDFNSFCNSGLGIKYDILNNAIIGASYKDGATLLENKEPSFFTIGKIGEKVINSYNRATPIITPSIVLEDNNNTYFTKYNEVILDSKYIIPCEIVGTKIYENEAKILSQKLNIPYSIIEIKVK